MASSVILVRCQLPNEEKTLSPHSAVQVNMCDKVSRAFFATQLADHLYDFCKL